MATNYVFVDFENVQALDFSGFQAKEVVITILLGALQKKLDAELVERLLSCPAEVKLIRLQSSGKNALDFALCFYLGQVAALDTAGYFHIVSRDKGFDPLIEHLRTQEIKAKRHDTFATLTFSRPAQKKPSETEISPLVRALKHLRGNLANRPKRQKTLVTHLGSLLGMKSDELTLTKVVDQLVDGGFIKIGPKGTVEYVLTDS